VGFGEAGLPALDDGLELAELWADGLSFKELGNYSETVNPDKSWFQWSGAGRRLDFILNNSATVNAGQSDSKWCNEDDWPFSGEYAPYFGLVPDLDVPAPTRYGTISGPIVNLYKYGDISVYLKINQNKECNYLFRVRLMNYNDPGEVLYSDETSKEHLGGQHSQHTAVFGSEGDPDKWELVFIDATECVSGGCVDTPQYAEFYCTFKDITGPKTYQVLLDYLIWNRCQNQFSIDKVVITDSDFADSFQSWGTAFALIHVNNIAGISKDPQFTAIVKGLGRQPGQEEGNPALCLYQFLTGYSDSQALESLRLPITHSVPRSEIDWPSVEETIDFCNALKGGEGYRFNRTFGAGIATDKVLKEITAAGRFFLIRKAGKWYFKPDRDEPPSYVLSDPGEIAQGSLQVGIGEMTVPNREEAQYLESGLAYTSQRFNVENSEDIDATGLRAETLDLSGVTDQRQAFELASFALNCHWKNQYWCKFKVGLKSLRFCHVGDLIQIDTDNPLVAGLTWRIVSAERESHLFSISCSQHDPAAYTSQLAENGIITDEDGFEAFSPWYYLPTDYSTPTHWPGGASGASQIYNLSAVLNYSSSALLTQVTLSYTFDKDRCSTVSIEYSYDNETWYAAGSTDLSSFTFNYSMENGVLLVRVRAIYAGIAGDWAYLVQDLTGPVYPGFGRGQFGAQLFGY
jgi:hypothetical protein